jgi:hypothetical protein
MVARNRIAERPIVTREVRRSRELRSNRVVLFEFTGDIAPEAVLRLVTGLRSHFPETRVWVEVEPQLRVLAKDLDSQHIGWMRAFCMGFVEAL